MRYRLPNKFVLTAFICVVLILTFISVVFSRSFRMPLLPDKGKNFGCGTCHVDPKGGGTRNPFGKDWGKIAIKAGDTYTTDLGKLDSDGDKFTNDQEFAANTNPGDANSKPASDPASSNAVDPKAEFTKAINKGKAIFNDAKLGKTNQSCNSCHGTTGNLNLKGAAATFPKYKATPKSVITLSQMNNLCIQMNMKGNPLKLDSFESVALAAYVTSLSNGIAIQVGN